MSRVRQRRRGWSVRSGYSKTPRPRDGHRLLRRPPQRACTSSLSSALHCLVPFFLSYNLSFLSAAALVYRRHLPYSISILCCSNFLRLPAVLFLLHAPPSSLTLPIAPSFALLFIYSPSPFRTQVFQIQECTINISFSSFIILFSLCACGWLLFRDSILAFSSLDDSFRFRRFAIVTGLRS